MGSSDEKRILDYMRKQNRPYSAIDVFSNLHKEIGKTAVIKCLDSLSDSGKLISKVYGKQKVYVFNQMNLPAANEHEMQELDSKIDKLQKEYNELKKECSKKEAEVKLYNNSITTEEARDQISSIESQLIEKKEKLKRLRENVNKISSEERNNILKGREVNIRHWRKRKRMTTDMLDAILEGYPKRKKDLYEEVGIETDEDCGVTIPDI